MNKFKTNIFLFVLTAICLNFYDALFLPGVFKILRLLFLGVIVPLSIFYSNSYKGEFSLPIKILTISMILSIIMSFLGWDQSIFLGILITTPFILWPIYNILFKLKITINQLENIIIIFGILYIIGYFFQFLNPSNIQFSIGTSVKDDEIVESRGIVRVMFPGGTIFGLSSYIALIKLTRGDKYKYLWLILSLLGLVIPFMQVTRSLLAITMLVYAYHFMKYTNIKRKLIIIALLIFAGAATLQYTMPLIDGMLEAVEKNSDEGSKYIRVLAAQYFLNDFSPSFITQIFGNGMAHERGDYGQFLKYLKVNRGFFLSDVGIIGVYTYFGIFYVIGWLIIYYKVIRIPISKDYIYVKYFFFVAISGSLLGSSLFHPTSVISTIYTLCIFDLYLKKEKTKQIKIKILKLLINRKGNIEIPTN